MKLALQKIPAVVEGDALSMAPASASTHIHQRRATAVNLIKSARSASRTVIGERHAMATAGASQIHHASVYIRIHTREMPVVIVRQICSARIAMFSASRAKLAMATGDAREMQPVNVWKTMTENFVKTALLIISETSVTICVSTRCTAAATVAATRTDYAFATQASLATNASYVRTVLWTLKWVEVCARKTVLGARPAVGMDDVGWMSSDQCMISVPSLLCFKRTAQFGLSVSVLLHTGVTSVTSVMIRSLVRAARMSVRRA